MSLSALTARLNAAFQSVEPDRYAKKHKPAAGQQGFRWITLNGGSGDDGDGGTRVKIDDGGKIHAGPAALEGRNLDNLGGKPKGKPKPKAAAPKPKSDAAAKALEANETRAKGPAAKPAEAGDSGQWSPENHVKIAADSIDKLRGQDVYRLLDSAPPAMAGSMANYIRKNRPDLSGDVHDAQIDLAEERGGSGGDAGEADDPRLISPGEAVQRGMSYGEWENGISRAFVEEKINDDHPLYKALSDNPGALTRKWNDAKGMQGRHVYSGTTNAIGILEGFDDNLNALVRNPDGKVSQHDPGDLGDLAAKINHDAARRQGEVSRTTGEYLAPLIAKRSVEENRNISDIMREVGVDPVKARGFRKLVMSHTEKLRDEQEQAKAADISPARKKAQEAQQAALAANETRAKGAATEPALPDHVDARELKKLDAKIDRHAATMEKHGAIANRPQQTPGPFATGRSGYTMGKKLDAENNRRSEAFRSLQEAKREHQRLTSIREGYVAGRVHPNGQPRRPGAVEARAAAKERNQQTIAEKGYDTRKIHRDLSADGASKLSDGRQVSFRMDFDSPDGGYQYVVTSPGGTETRGKFHSSISKMQSSGELKTLLAPKPAATATAGDAKAKALAANESRVKGPTQSSAPQSEFAGQEDHQRGDRVRYTGNVNADGFHEFEYLEGHRKGQKGVTDNPMGSQNQARKEKATAEFNDQQAGFKRLREAQQRQQQEADAKPKPKMLEEPDGPFAFKLKSERAFKPQPKSLFGNPKDYGPEQQSDLEKIEANLAQRKNEALAGQKGLYSRVRSAVNRYMRTGNAARYDATGGGKWITLNGDSGADGDGGTPVFIKPGGEIAKGPKSLKGKDLDNLPSKPKPAGDPQARRAELAKQVTDGATHAERSAARKEIAEIDRTLADDSRPKGPRGPAAAPKPPSPTAGVDEKREAALKANETRAKGPATPPRPAWMKKQPADGLEPGQEEGTFTLKREKANKPRGITGKQGALFDPTEDAVAPEQEQLPGAAKPLTRLQKKDGITVGAAQVHYSDLAVDPKRFQYKFQGIGDEGVTDELKGVKKFNPMLGGQLLAWHDPEDGKAYVVNGHHRHELARRSGEHADWDGHLPTYFVNAKTAKEARALGALANIAEGRGTAVDAAKFLRDTGTSAENLYGEHGISLKGAVARDAQILTKLSGGLFDRLATGSMETGRALAIASELGDHDKQLELVRSIEQTENKRGKALTDGTVREMAKMMDLSKTAKGEGGGLFDDFAEKSSFVERAELLAHLRRTLSTEMKTFKQAASTRRQAALESTGTNKLDVEGNRERAKSAETAIWDFDTRANARGDALATAISDAAEELANAPRKRKSIEKRLTETVRGVLAGEADGGGTDADRGDVTRNARRGRARQPSRYARQAMIRDLSRILRT